MNEIKKINNKYNLKNHIMDWLVTHPVITITSISSTALLIGAINGIVTAPFIDNPSTKPHDKPKSIPSDRVGVTRLSYESEDIVYVIIKSNGIYDENILKEAIDNNKKIGIIIEPNTNENFINTILSQIYYIIAKYRIDLPILYDINTLKNDMDNNIKIAKKLFTEFDKFALYVGFLGSSYDLDNFKYYYGDDFYKYDKMIRSVDKSSSLDANMIMYNDDHIQISYDIINVIANSNINKIGEYTIKAGDKLDRIALKYNIPDVVLTNINNLSKNDLQFGNVLYVPILGYNTYENSTVKGIDISYCQGNIDGRKLVEEGVNFIIIRVCDCYTSNLSENYTIDYKLKDNIEECLKYNIPFSLYYYTRAKSVNDAYLEAKFIKRNLDPLEEILNSKIPLYMDIESDTFFEPQQNIENLFTKLYYSEELSNKFVQIDEDTSIVLQAQTIIDAIYNYFNQYKKGVFNKEQIVYTVDFLKEFVETNKLYYYNELGEQEEITEYIGFSSHNNEMPIYDLNNNVEINLTNDGYEISINRFNSDYEFDKTEKISVSLEEIDILMKASEIIQSRYNDEEFIKNLENCFSPECIISTVSNTLGSNYKLGIYSSEDITKKINNWNNDYNLWVTSHETYGEKIEFENWNVENIPIKYDWANVVQYSDSGRCNGLASIVTDVDISTKEYIKSFISVDDILGYDVSVGLFNQDEYQHLR